MADFDALHSRVNDKSSVSLGFDLLSIIDRRADLRPEDRFANASAALRKVLSAPSRGIQYVEHTECLRRQPFSKRFQAVCQLGLEGIVSKKLDAPYRSGPSKTWIKVKNPKAPAATRAIDRTF